MSSNSIQLGRSPLGTLVKLFTGDEVHLGLLYFCIPCALVSACMPQDSYCSMLHSSACLAVLNDTKYHPITIHHGIVFYHWSTSY